MKDYIELKPNVTEELKQQRYALVLNENDEDIKCELKDVKKGDLFRLFEKDGTQIVDEECGGIGWFIAYKNAELRDGYEDRYEVYFYAVCTPEVCKKLI